MTRRAVLAIAVVPAGFAARWDEARFPEWPQEFIDRLVTNSPWAHPWTGTVTVQPFDHRNLSSSFQTGIGFPSPIPGIGWPRRSPRTSPGPGTRFPRDQSDSPIRIPLELTIRWASALPLRRAFALQECGRDGLESDRARQLLGDPETYTLEIAGIPRLMAGDPLRRDLQNARLSIPGHRSLSPSEVEMPSIGAYTTATLKFPRVDEYRAMRAHSVSG
jgi:hypothetical protein